MSDKLLSSFKVFILSDKNSSIDEIKSDSLSLHVGLLSELGNEWIGLICEEINFTKKAADLIGMLGRNLYIAESGDTEKKNLNFFKDKAASMFYDKMDIPFREWLRSISVTDSDIEQKRGEWREKVIKSAESLGSELAQSKGPAAFTGRMAQIKGEKSIKYYSTAKSYLYFKRKLSSLNQEGGEKQ